MAGARTIVGDTTRRLPQVRSAIVDRLLGALIVAVLPTVFWIGILVSASAAFELNVATGVVVVAGMAALAVLCCIWASVTLARDPSSERSPSEPD